MWEEALGMSIDEIIGRVAEWEQRLGRVKKNLHVAGGSDGGAYSEEQGPAT